MLVLQHINREKAPFLECTLNLLGEDSLMKHFNLENKKSVWKHSKDHVYLMVDHRYAFVVWEYLRMKKSLESHAILVHVDTHLDDVPELLEQEKVMGIRSIDDLRSVVKWSEAIDEKIARGEEPSDRLYLREDNFIIPSFCRDGIQKIIYVSNEENRTEAQRDYNTIDCIESLYSTNLSKLDVKFSEKSIERYMGVRKFVSHCVDWSNDFTLLDLDLDYFNNSNTLWESNLKNDDEIRSELRLLKDYTEWDVITIAISPGYSGEEQAAQKLLAYFLEIFELEAKDFEQWEI